MDLTLDAGSLPDWVAGGGAVLAVVVAALSLRASHRALHLQQLQLREAADQLRAEQVGKLAAWMQRTDDGRVCRVRNQSTLPVLLVTVFLTCRSAPDGDEAEAARWWYRIDVGLAPPGEDRVVPVAAEAFFDIVNADPAGRFYNQLTYMVDAAGRCWERRYDGSLRMIERREFRARTGAIPAHRLVRGASPEPDLLLAAGGGAADAG